MLKVYTLSDLNQQDIARLCKRNVDEKKSIEIAVESIIHRVRSAGDVALIAYAKQFDGVNINCLYLDKPELERLTSTISEEEKQALYQAYLNIKKFHQSQLKQEDKVETMAGVTCWRESRAIDRVGLYIPGGTAVLPSTFLMLGVPAQIVGCKEIIVCSPPQKDGQVNAYIAYCAHLLGIDRIYLVGGAQAIAAMAYGTESIPKVDKIFGPGNQYVTKAKMLIQLNTQTAIDMPAGPSEVLVIADETANPIYVAADLLAQAEHGIDSQAILVSNSVDMIQKVNLEIEKQLVVLNRSDIAGKALKHSYAVLVSDLTQAMSFSNIYAPEHLILAVDCWSKIGPEIKNAGSVFMGHFTPESAGDYASGTNHTLPTSSFAKAYSGVSVDSFIKKITFQHITKEGIRNLGPTVQLLAELEGLDAHKNAVTVRLG
jgi:histidinol dehydrogenase